MRIGATKTGDDDFGLVGVTVAVGVLHEQEIGAVGHPHTAVSDGDSRGDVQPLGEYGHSIDIAIEIGIFKDLNAIFARAGFGARILETFRHPDSAPFVKCHGNRIDQIGLCRHEFNFETGGNFHFL